MRLVTVWSMRLGTVALAAAMLLLPLPALADRPGAADLLLRAFRYEHGEGVPQDYGRALALYCDASRQGSAGAALDIGWMFLSGRGVSRDIAVGTAWLRLAARRGSGQAVELLELIVRAPAVETRGCGALARTLARRAPAKEIASLVASIGAETRLDPRLLSAVIATESAFQPDAVSPRQARGLMQLTDGTARRFGVSNVFEPADNIRGGALYLRWLLRRFDGDLPLALAGYNAGEGAVARYGGVPPYAETRAYVDRVLSLYPAPSDRLPLR
ncbi:MAG TPA: transglycosylase SLT domain-containing protein [Stellaceae bacterium]|nr:transglycosylase SLT domain-containing protein [Stellaceae bacterium]